MAYECAQCGISHPNYKVLVEHMVLVHNSPYYEGDAKYIAHSKKVCEDNKKAELLKNFD